MRAAFHTLGCKVNQYETELMKEELQKNGAGYIAEKPSEIYNIIREINNE